MPAFTPEIEQKIKNLGQALKLQFDFAAAADMTQGKDQLAFAEKNTRTQALTIELMHLLNIPMAESSQIMLRIAAIAEENGSKAGAQLKKLAPKILAINTEATAVAQQKGPAFTGADLNAIFKKHLKPN